MVLLEKTNIFSYFRFVDFTVDRVFWKCLRINLCPDVELWTKKIHNPTRDCQSNCVVSFNTEIMFRKLNAPDRNGRTSAIVSFSEILDLKRFCEIKGKKFHQRSLKRNLIEVETFRGWKSLHTKTIWTTVFSPFFLFLFHGRYIW